jgi:acetyl esterase/lipase
VYVRIEVVPSTLLIFGALSFALAFNAVRPRFAPAGVAAVSFFAGWLTAELAAHLFVLYLAVVGTLVWNGALASLAGRLGFGLSVGAVLLLLVSWRRSAASRGVVDAFVAELAGEDTDEPLKWRRLVLPFPVRHEQAERVAGITYFDDGRTRLRLDVWRAREQDHSPTARRPVLIFVHGGGWVIGYREQQGLPLLHSFAARGWVCFSVDYRLSPQATFPDHIVDVKRAIAWVKEHAAEYGGDPDFVVITGASAGGHLASLAALTPGRAEWQPGFEHVDTSVAACVSFYGIYDFTDRHGHWPNPGLIRLLERSVMKVKLADEPEKYAVASPVTHVSPSAPPFLVVHGTLDSLVPVAEGRQFVSALRQVSRSPVTYLEVPGAQHAFEVFPSLRALHVLRGVIAFCESTRRRARGEAALRA